MLTPYTKNLVQVLNYLWNLPVEMPGPSEPADLEVESVSVVVLHGLVVDDVNDWNDESLRILLDPLKKRPEPVLK